jgi:FKBP-type peptidyl-prolyl cis-trans isomerase 2
MKHINRPNNLDNLRKVVVNPEKTVPLDTPDQVQVPALTEPFGPSENNPFRPGDTVIYKYNQKGTVLSVKGDGVQVDFGLGIHYLSYLVLKLSQN